MNETWRETLKTNFVKSLDHRSYYFKQDERKLLSLRQMILDIKELRGGGVDKSLTLDFNDCLTHFHAFIIIKAYVEKNLNNRLDIDRFLTSFEKIIFKLFGINGIRNTLKVLVSEKMKNGMKCLSRFGLGTIVKEIEDEELIEIKVDSCNLKVNKNQVFEANNNNTVPVQRNDFYFGENGYWFLRVYQILCERLKKAEILIEEKEILRQLRGSSHHHRRRKTRGVSSSSGSNDIFEHHRERNNDDNSQNEEEEAATSGDAIFEQMMNEIKLFVGGGEMDANQFEEEICSLLGTGCYFLFTLDKLVSSVVRSFQGMINDEKAILVLDQVKKYKEKKTASNVASLYRNCVDSLSVGTNVCACVKVKYIQGVEAFAEDNTTSSSSSSVSLKKPVGKLQLEFLDHVPSSLVENEIEYVQPLKIDWKKNNENKETSVLALGSSPSTRSKRYLESQIFIILSIFSKALLPCTDEILKKINEKKNEDGGDWWTNVESEEDSNTSASEEASPPPQRKRSRAATDASD